MHETDILISGGEVITAFWRKHANLAIREGRIAAILEPGDPQPSAARIIDATGMYVFPGLIDPHTHISGGAKVFGGLPAAVQGCTRALALGGTTTVMEMISAPKDITLPDTLAQAREQRQGSMAIDYAFHPSIRSTGDRVLAELEACADQGTPSFHASFESSRGREPLDEGGLYRLFTLARDRHLLPILHAEDSQLNNELIKRTPNAHRIENVTRCRPWFSETAAVGRALFMARLVGAPVYFEHLGAGPSLDLIRAGRREHLPFYAETCPHYLCFSEEIYSTPRGVEFLKAPPLKRREDSEALWRGISDGSISAVSTDESTALIDEKTKRLNQIPAYEVSGGLNQIEVRLAVMYTEMVVRRGMPIERLVYCLSTGAAILFGVYPRKGTIAVGSDADIVLFDPKISKRVRNADLHQGTDYTIFEGWELHGYPRTTILRGKILVENGEFVGSDRGGEWLPRSISHEVMAPATNSLLDLCQTA